MKCGVCERMLRESNKSGICSNCGSKSLRLLILEGFLTLEDLNKLKMCKR